MKSTLAFSGMTLFSLWGCQSVEARPEVAPAAEVGRSLRRHPDMGPHGGGGDCQAGTLDPGFGGAGTGIARLSIQPDDAGGFYGLDLVGQRIVAAGWGLGGVGGTTFKVARLRRDGTRDPTFADGAVVRTQWGASASYYAFARAVGHQRDRRVVAIGHLEHNAQFDVALTRYTVDGALDTATFGTDGKPLIDLGGVEIIESGLVAPDDTILAVGSRDGQVLVARFTANGHLDTSFAGGTGYFTAAIGESSTAAAVALDSCGQIVVAGSTSACGQSDMLVLRLTHDGELDPSFGTGGYVLAGAPAVNERAVSLAVTRHGDLVVAGNAGTDQRDFQVRRFRAGGSPDPTFGHAGVVTDPITDGDDQAESMALVPGDGLLVVGNAFGGSSDGPVVARYTRDGALDPSFGSGGVQPVDVGEFGAIHTVVIDSRRGALLGGGDEGTTPGPGTFLVVARMCL